MEIVYHGKSNRSWRIAYMFNEHIIKGVTLRERRHYTPLIIGALQEHMVELIITLKVLQKGGEATQKEIVNRINTHIMKFEYMEEMSNFSYNVNIFATALQQDLPKEFVSQLLQELLRELEEVFEKIREIASRK
jgi:hypothetical protein